MQFIHFPDSRTHRRCNVYLLKVEVTMFKVLKTEGAARRGEFSCPHGTVQTPVFMNVGTQAAIKGALSAADLEKIGTQIELSNTYHLHLRPGDEVVRDMGGLHKFMTWNGPILTDSGGFQVFSLAGLRKIKEEGVTLEQGKIPEKDMWKYSSFWFKDFDGMALKTMLRQLISKWGIMSIDLQNAIDKDMAVIHEDGKTDYVDAVKAEDDGVVSDQELQEVQEDQPAAPGTQQPDPNGIEASFFG